MKFGWDEAKAASNLVKHGVSFEEAATVFADPALIEGYDRQHSDDGEDRWQIVGLSARLKVLAVVMTERDGDVVWIISARRATRQESRFYEEEIQKRQGH